MEYQEECSIISDGIKILFLFLILIAVIITATQITKEKEKEYTLICETKQEIIITNGEDIITIEKEETKGENEE